MIINLNKRVLNEYRWIIYPLDYLRFIMDKLIKKDKKKIDKMMDTLIKKDIPRDKKLEKCDKKMKK